LPSVIWPETYQHPPIKSATEAANAHRLRDGEWPLRSVAGVDCVAHGSGALGQFAGVSDR
jgi:hypothetical protein